ncbi:hypothetical protein [Flavihumibacter fluvii]|uniref:hypothetical protein n=1 Tax=Flavihumibacter fluvii TaxID=2838157 RepID=UPI001BDF03E6|nr:hypothetical protein [Flavihumibacter fluvii]ULQ54693.1 hypothetical protein KJS93_10225 [Flavihumibacter fluvii]
MVRLPKTYAELLQSIREKWHHASTKETFVILNSKVLDGRTGAFELPGKEW